MLIDAHHHLWDPVERPLEWLDPQSSINRRFDAEDFEGATAGADITHSIVVQTLPSIAETIDLLGVARRSSLIAGVVGWIDLHEPVAPQLETLASRSQIDRLVGIRHQAQDEDDDLWLASSIVASAVGDLANRDITYDLLVLPHQLPAAISLARAQPEARLVLDHCGKPQPDDLSSWQLAIAELGTLPNVACKLSGLVTEASSTDWQTKEFVPIWDIVLSAFGSSRLLFGSDWPVCLLAASYQEVFSLAQTLSDALGVAEKRALFGENTRRWYPRLDTEQK